MATKLKNMKLTSVDLVRAGANQEADICLFKSAEPPGATESPTEYETNIIKRFINWLREYPTEAQNEPQNPIEKGDDVPDLEFIYKSALTESLQSIMADETLTDIEKKNMAEESLRQYAEKIQEMEDAEEFYDGGANIDEKAVEAVDDFDKDDYPDFDDDDEYDDDEDTIEEEIIEEIREERHERPRRRPRYDFEEIEEVELNKYNHNHGADGKFSESPGAGGGSSSGGSGSKKPSEMEYKELENEVLSIRSKLNTASREEKRELINRSFDLQTEMDRRLASGERNLLGGSKGKSIDGKKALDTFSRSANQKASWGDTVFLPQDGKKAIRNMLDKAEVGTTVSTDNGKSLFEKAGKDSWTQYKVSGNSRKKIATGNTSSVATDVTIQCLKDMGLEGDELRSAIRRADKK